VFNFSQKRILPVLANGIGSLTSKKFSGQNNLQRPGFSKKLCRPLSGLFQRQRKTGAYSFLATSPNHVKDFLLFSSLCEKYCLGELRN